MARKYKNYNPIFVLFHRHYTAGISDFSFSIGCDFQRRKLQNLGLLSFGK